MGCFLKGCLITIVVGVILLGGLAAVGWYFYGKVVNVFTAAQPADVATDPPTDAQFQVAGEKLDRLRIGMANDEVIAVEFTADDINALFARHPDFAGARNRARVSIADSIAVVEMSVPLRQAPLPKLKKRWFNGTAAFGFRYSDGEYQFAPKLIRANGREIPREFFSEEFVSSFNRSFSAGAKDPKKQDVESRAFWERVKEMAVEGDKLIIVTQAAR